MMQNRSLIVSGTIVLAAMLVLLIADPSSAGLRFLAKLAIAMTVLIQGSLVTITAIFGKDTTRKLFANVVLIGISVGIALLAGEFVVRLAYRDVTTTSDASSYFSSRWYSEHPLTLNQWGFREQQLPESKPPGAYRIAVVGDSFAFGQGILTEDRFSDRLRESLHEASSRYEIWNFGRPGAETDDHLQILDDVVLDMSPDFVLLQWFVNDVEIAEAGRSQPMRLVPSTYLHRWLISRSSLYYLANSNWASIQSQLGLTENYIDNMTRRFADPTSEESRAASAALERLILRLSERNVPLGIVIFPLLVDVDGDESAYPLGFLLDRVVETCDRHDVPCLDLRSTFASSLSASDLWANRLDHHPGPEAHRVASIAILDRFRAIWESM